MSHTAPGWYPDPQNPDTLFRYWDGTAWTDDTSPQHEQQAATVGAPAAAATAAAPGVTTTPSATTGHIAATPAGNIAAASPVQRGTGTSPGSLSTIGRRIGGWAIDSFGWFLALIVAGIIGGATGNETIAAVLTGLAVLGTLGAQAYFAFTSAQTIGKKVLGMQVVDKDTRAPLSGGRYVFVRGLLGMLVGMIPLVGFVLLFMPLWDEWNQSVGGKISNSIVVDVA